MAKLNEIFEIEKIRQERETWNKVNLFVEGSFYRANEWSAWLLVVLAKKDLKVTHKAIKSLNTTIVFVGFPMTSIQKFSSADFVFKAINDKQAELIIPTDLLPADATYETLTERFSKWKTEQPLADKAPSQEIERTTAIKTLTTSAEKGNIHISDVMRRILSYQVEQHTPLDCMTFLSEIKAQLSEIL